MLLLARAALGILAGAIAIGSQPNLVGDVALRVLPRVLGAGPSLKDTAEITFSGYQSLPDGRGILFVEMTDPVAVEVKRVGQVIEYKLVGARVPLKNNRNPLLLRDFSSSVMSAVLVPDKKPAGRKHKGEPSSVRLVVTLRSPTSTGQINPSHRMVARGKGAALEIDFPALSPAPR